MLALSEFNACSEGLFPLTLSETFFPTSTNPRSVLVLCLALSASTFTKERYALTTPALSSKYRKTPSVRFHGLLCLTITAGMTFFLSSGFPFLTVAITISPTPPAGNLFRRAPIPLTEMMYRFRAPELSAQFITAPLDGYQLRVLAL